MSTDPDLLQVITALATAGSRLAESLADACHCHRPAEDILEDLMHALESAPVA